MRRAQELFKSLIEIKRENIKRGDQMSKLQLQPVSMEGVNFNITDEEKFRSAIKLLKESLWDKGESFFASDNLITWNRCLSFLREDNFRSVIFDNSINTIEKSIIWRTYTLIYFARVALRISGDLVECGCHMGYTAGQVISFLELEKHKKKYWLYDLFEWKPGDDHTPLEVLNDPMMHQIVKDRFKKYSFVNIIKGRVPNSFSEALPDEICFAHIDMNSPTAEAAALREILPRLVSGGSIVFDDYGWLGYSEQKCALDPIVKEFGQSILELPTGQGILIKV